MNTCKIFRKNYRPFLWVLSLALSVSLAITACDTTPPQPTPDPNTLIQAAVAATLASIPRPTSAPIPTIAPTPTAFSFEDVFCEYNFCIGHPKDLYLLDQGTTRNPPQPSTYGYGIIFGYSQTLFIEMAWTTSGTAYDPQNTMHYILEEKESLQGSLTPELIGKLNVYYQPISTVTEALPYGGIASWQCGGRDFAWKVYTPQDGMATGLLKQALEKFRCQGQ